MGQLSVVSGKELVKILQRQGFSLVRIKGSHHRLVHVDGRATTVPVHKSDEIPKGLLRKIIREDLQITVDEFEMWAKK
jgi:predicted RNA binding protein YcfA (HicA-like mRNA interferase family)